MVYYSARSELNTLKNYMLVSSVENYTLEWFVTAYLSSLSCVSGATPSKNRVATEENYT